MALYRWSQSPYNCKRFDQWWACLFEASRKTDLAPYVDHFLFSGTREVTWICTQDSYESALEMMRIIPGWSGPDGLLHPLLGVRLSPKEEHDALKQASPELRAKLVPECTCPPHATRFARKMAEKAWHEWLRAKEKALGLA